MHGGVCTILLLMSAAEAHSQQEFKPIAKALMPCALPLFFIAQTGGTKYPGNTIYQRSPAMSSSSSSSSQFRPCLTWLFQLDSGPLSQCHAV